jgi:hypothetical protein
MSSDAAISPLNVVDYSPGVCNIGPAEIARRRRSGHVALAITVLGFVALVAVGAPAWTRLILILPAGGSASGYLQAFFHFCAGFGSRGIYNFGAIGTTQAVTDPGARARDRTQSIRIGLGALAIGAVVGIVAFLLPV